MFCYYHGTDLDGRCSGAIIKYTFRNRVQMIPVDYGDSTKPITAGSTVFIVDFSFPMDQMILLSEQCKLFWIDHHESAIEEAEALNFHPPGVREIGVAACELTWKALHPDDPMPRAVKLLGRYDVWDHRIPETLPFQYGMRIRDTDPENQSLWGPLFEETKYFYIQEYSDVLNDGNVFIRGIEEESERLKSVSWERTVRGLHLIIINQVGMNSHYFQRSYDPSQHDAMCAFYFNGRRWKFSFFTTKPEVNLKRYAQSFGGGGHTNAAGFTTQKFPSEFLP